MVILVTRNQNIANVQFGIQWISCKSNHHERGYLCTQDQNIIAIIL